MDCGIIYICLVKPNLKEQSIIVCSIVRNAAKGLRRNIPIINRLCALFKTYDIIVYENDSTDNTRELLINWKKYNKSNIHIICEDVESSSTVPSSSEVRCNPFFSKKRIAKMAYLRNKYMKYIDENKLVADYIVIVDLDVAELYLEDIINSFEIEKEWDVICAYGYSLGPSLRRRYHDTYALSLHGESNIPQTERFIFELPRKLAKDFNNSIDLYPVDSAFGGLAIYKFNAIQGLRYKVIDNDDSRVEVRCEHFSLNRQAAERGYTRIFINPEMKLKYQSISLQQINKRIISVVRCILKTILTKKIINIQCPPLILL
jgi:hypothetical protein